MNDDYIKRFRKLPDSRLIERIHARLEKRERRKVIKRYSLLSFLALTFVFGLLMTFSSTVRAAVLQAIEQIAGLRFEVTTDYPGDPDKPVVELVPEHLTWEEARSRFLSPLQLPAYVPQGYEQEPKVQLYIWGDGSPSLQIVWRKESYVLIGMFITQCRSDSPSCGTIVGDGALQEFTLNGKPAVLIRGGWNSDVQEWDRSIAINIMWRYDENTVYQLFSGDENLLDELIKMAESIP